MLNPPYIYHQHVPQSIKLKRTIDDSSVLDTLPSHTRIIYYYVSFTHRRSGVGETLSDIDTNCSETVLNIDETP